MKASKQAGNKISVKVPTDSQLEAAAAESKAVKPKRPFAYTKPTTGDPSSSDAANKRRLFLGLAYGGAALVTAIIISVVVYFAVFAGPPAVQENELELARMSALQHQIEAMHLKADEKDKEALKAIQVNASSAKEHLLHMKEEKKKMEEAKKAAEEEKARRLQELEEKNKELEAAQAKQDQDSQDQAKELQAQIAAKEAEFKELEKQNDERLRMMKEALAKENEALQKTLEEIQNSKVPDSPINAELAELQETTKKLADQVQAINNTTMVKENHSSVSAARTAAGVTARLLFIVALVAVIALVAFSVFVTLKSEFVFGVKFLDELKQFVLSITKPDAPIEIFVTGNHHYRYANGKDFDYTEAL